MTKRTTLPYNSPVASQGRGVFASRKSLLLLTLFTVVVLTNTPWRPTRLATATLSATTLSTPSSSSSSSSTTTLLSTPPQSSHDRSHLPGRLAEAVFMAIALRQTGAHLELHCPDEQHIGERMERQPAADVGTPCEPWQNRDMITVLWHVLDSSMVGLEWSSGSGTAWLLRRGLTMHSVEHCEPWLQDIQGKLQSVIGQVAVPTTKWYPHHVARSDGQGCSQERVGGYTDSMKVFGDYVNYPRQHLLAQYAPNGFDLVEVDGRFRKGGVMEAAGLHQKNPRPPLVKLAYGMVLLDNSDRNRYGKVSEIPSYWLVVSFQTASFGETSLWMACPTVDDGPCTQARRRIVDLMATLPPEYIGHRFTQHMSRAVQDGVPGACGSKEQC